MGKITKETLAPMAEGAIDRLTRYVDELIESNPALALSVIQLIETVPEISDFGLKLLLRISDIEIVKEKTED
jgi:hypothetical protein